MKSETWRRVELCIILCVLNSLCLKTLLCAATGNFVVTWLLSSRLANRRRRLNETACAQEVGTWRAGLAHGEMGQVWVEITVFLLHCIYV